MLFVFCLVVVVVVVFLPHVVAALIQKTSFSVKGTNSFSCMEDVHFHY